MDTITLDAQIPPFSYVIGSAAVTAGPPTITHLHSACAINYNLYYFDSTEDIWVVDNISGTLDFTTFDTATGLLTVSTAATKYSIETIWSLKIVVTLPDS